LDNLQTLNYPPHKFYLKRRSIIIEYSISPHYIFNNTAKYGIKWHVSPNKSSNVAAENEKSGIENQV